MKILPIDEKIVDKVFENVMEDYDKPASIAKRNLKDFYTRKIIKDSEELSKQGISSKTYFKEDFDITLHTFLFLLKRSHGYDYDIHESTFDIIWK